MGQDKTQRDGRRVAMWGEEGSKTVTITDGKRWLRSWRREKEGREATMRRI
jgi:hypothetical protein